MFCHPRPAPGGKSPARFRIDSGPATLLDSNPGLVSRQAREFPKTMKSSILSLLLGCACLVPATANAQVNSGSDGHDGAFNPTQNVTIDMADHPDGIYHYTTVNIPAGVTVTFKPNAKNSPVVWLVQGNCVIGGNVNVSGRDFDGVTGGISGPGGWRGGNGGGNSSAGQGPGGGAAGAAFPIYGGGGSFATQGASGGPIYGNKFQVPLLGGSGGGGQNLSGGGGGGGAMLIAATNSIEIFGSVSADGGKGHVINGNEVSGCGSGGGLRMVTKTFGGTGQITASGGSGWEAGLAGGSGRVRIDTMDSTFGGNLLGSVSQGFQPIILPAAGQGVQLSIASIAGTAVSQSPSGVLANPDVIIPSQLSNPLPVVVNCSNIPLNTEITVVVHPANGPDVQAVAMNNAGTLATSTATVSLNMPRGGGIIYAKCVSGVANLGVDTPSKELRTKSLAETGWTADGERFAKMEIAAALDGSQQITYITESGKRYPLAIR